MIRFKCLTFNPFQENTWIIWNDENDCVILDPGCSNSEEESLLSGFIDEKELKPKAVWLTHCHIDHVLGLQFCLNNWGLPYFLHPLEAAQLKSVEVYAPLYGIHSFRMPEGPGFEITTGQLTLGEEPFEIIHLPGHSPGHLAFHHSSSGQIWAGDVLFFESIGRTDLPGGSMTELTESIRRKLYNLPAETIVYPGHGPKTDIGHEMRLNPFVRP